MRNQLESLIKRSDKGAQEACQRTAQLFAIPPGWSSMFEDCSAETDAGRGLTRIPTSRHSSNTMEPVDMFTK